MYLGSEYPLPPGHTPPPQERTWDQRYPPRPRCGQTDTCENITFPQLRWRAVTIRDIDFWQSPLRCYNNFFLRCGLKGVEPGPGETWDPAVANIFEEILQQTITLTVWGRDREKYIVRLQDENGADISTKITSLGLSIFIY